MNSTIAPLLPGQTPSPAPPPRVSYRWPVAWTVVGLSVWALLTIGALWILPPLLTVIDRVEVAFGLDLAVRPPASAKP